MTRVRENANDLTADLAPRAESKSEKEVGGIRIRSGTSFDRVVQREEREKENEGAV